MIPHATNASKSKLVNLWVVFETVRLYGPLPRIRISEMTGLSKQATSDLVEELIRGGFVRHEKSHERQVGKPPQPLALDPRGAFSFGFHIDEGRLAYVEQNLLGEVLRGGLLELPEPDVDRATAAIIETVAALRATTELDASRFLGIGLATPGPFGSNVIRPPHMQKWDGGTLRDRLAGTVDFAVLLANEGQCAITAEAYFGDAAKSFTDFLYISLGKGLGSAAMINRTAYGGAYGNAGEFGHTIVVPGGHECVCGKRGCLETYVSLTSLKRYLQRHDVAVPSFAMLERDFSAENPLVARWIEEGVEPLRNGLSTLENLFEPETTMFGGDAPDWLIDAFVEAVQPLYPSLRRPDSAIPRLVRSEFGAGAMPRGAAFLPVLAQLSPRHQFLGGQGGFFTRTQ